MVGLERRLRNDHQDMWKGAHSKFKLSPKDNREPWGDPTYSDWCFGSR